MFMPKTVRAILAGTVAVATMVATTPVASARDIEETEVSAGGCIKYYISYLDKFDDFMMTIKYNKRGAMQCSIQLTPLDSDFGPAPRFGRGMIGRRPPASSGRRTKTPCTSGSCLMTTTRWSIAARSIVSGFELVL